MNFLTWYILVVYGLAVAAHPVCRWVLYDLRLECQGANKCILFFRIAEQQPATNIELPKEDCHLSITAAEDGQPASNTSFTNMVCAALPQYRVDGVWNEKRSITLAVTNIEKSQCTFFSYDRDQIEMVKIEDPTYKINNLSQRSANAAAPVAHKAQSPDKHAESWTVEAFNRGKPC